MSSTRGDAPAADPSRELGELLRRLRRRNGLTLVQVAERSGLSHSFISQLERGLTHASMLSLERIAGALGTSVHVLMAREDTGPVSLVRVTDEPVARERGSVVRALIRGNRTMQAIEIDGISTAWTPAFAHPGDEFLYVLTGVLEVELDGDERHRLVAGDTVYYEGGVSHRWRRRGTGPLKVLMVSRNLAGDLRP